MAIDDAHRHETITGHLADFYRSAVGTAWCGPTADPETIEGPVPVACILTGIHDVRVAAKWLDAGEAACQRLRFERIPYADGRGSAEECNRGKESGVLWVVKGSHQELQSVPAAKVSE